MKESILIVDDDENMRDTMVDILESKGFEVSCAASSNEAIEKVKKVKYSVVLMEYDNNVIEYYQTYLTIKLLNPDVRILLLLSTVREVADEPLKSLYPENGVIGVLKKPFDMGEVVAYIEEFIVGK